MKRTAVIAAILALSATSAMACPYSSNVQASAPVSTQTASNDAPQSTPVSGAATTVTK